MPIWLMTQEQIQPLNPYVQIQFSAFTQTSQYLFIQIWFSMSHFLHKNGPDMLHTACNHGAF